MIQSNAEDRIVPEPTGPHDHQVPEDREAPPGGREILPPEENPPPAERNAEG
jgi:hypothetical protein